MNNLNKLDEYGILMTSKYVFFYANRCPFSNFYKPCDFSYSAFGESNVFFCSEQAFMWHKAMLFDDVATAMKILQEKSDPMRCKKLGRSVKNYDDAAWNEVRYDVFLEVNLQKFKQNENLKKFILQDKFEGKTFVEASPSDGIWGIKMAIGDPKIVDEKNWNGQNLLGKVITQVREDLKSENMQ